MSFPADYAGAELAGREATLEVTVKEVKSKQLPDLDEDFAIDAGFESGDGTEAFRHALLDRKRVFAGLRHATVRQAAQPAALQPGVEQRRGGVRSQSRHRLKITERPQK